MAYTTINKKSDHFNTKLFTGTGSSNAVTGVGFQPDLCWIKNRNATASMRVLDVVRGATKVLFTDGTDSESTNAQSLTSFDSDGFTVGTHSSVNGNGNGIVSWNWKCGGAGSANTDGAINSTVSANQTAGVSIVKYTGSGSAQTVGHGLNAVPKMIIVKRPGASGYDWVVYHAEDSAGLYLNTTGNNEDSSSSNIWFNGAAPTSAVFTTGTDGRIGNAVEYIAYCFAEKVGFSKFGSYVGNGSGQGSFIYCGFKPEFVIIRNSGTSQDWYILDTKRNPANVVNSYLRTNDNGAESTYNFIDIYSNGFKCNNNGGAANAANNSFIYMAFGQTIVGSNNVCATAR